MADFDTGQVEGLFSVIAIVSELPGGRFVEVS
jgi:hypothetical protein